MTLRAQQHLAGDSKRISRRTQETSLTPTPNEGVRNVIQSGTTSNQPLRGRVALVTGAGRRIGRAIALTLGGAGADVIVNYLGSQEGAQATVRELAALGVHAVGFRADVSRPAQVAAMFRAVEKRFGRLDLLVNNAGVFFPRKWDELEEKDWDRILGVNLKGPFFCAQAAARIMMRQGAETSSNFVARGS